MDLNAKKEQFSNAFLLAVAAVAGFAVAKPSVDHDSIDWTISSRLPRRPKIDVQLKCTSLASSRGESASISFPLSRKNYDELTVADLISPRILVVVVVPEAIDDWLTLSREEFVIRHCAHWVSLNGLPESGNTVSQTVQVPRHQLLDVAALQSLMQRANDGVAL